MIFMATKVQTIHFHSYGDLTWGWRFRWHAERPDGHNAGRTQWEPATHASPTVRDRQRPRFKKCGMQEGKGERENMVHLWSVVL